MVSVEFLIQFYLLEEVLESVYHHPFVFFLLLFFFSLSLLSCFSFLYLIVLIHTISKSLLVEASGFTFTSHRQDAQTGGRELFPLAERRSFCGPLIPRVSRDNLIWRFVLYGSFSYS